MNTTTTKPAIIQLDDASRSPSKTLSEYCKNCSNAVTNALNEFPVVQKTANCKISHGFVKENALISIGDIPNMRNYAFLIHADAIWHIHKQSVIKSSDYGFFF